MSKLSSEEMNQINGGVISDEEGRTCTEHGEFFDRMRKFLDKFSGGSHIKIGSLYI